jgi:L-lactate dehydrogenase
MKISIIGIGHVGSTIAFTIMLKDLADELILIDKSLVKATSDAQDLTHALAFTDHIIPIKGGEIEESVQSDIIIITASVAWHDNYTSRFDLGPGNLQLFKQIIPKISSLSPEAILVVISNPLDIMTYFAIKYSGFPVHKVLGVGTLLDSARFRKILSENYQIHPDDIRAYVIGEHGNSQFAATSAAYSGGVKIKDSGNVERLFRSSELSAYNIIKGKGYTNFAISMATALIVESIVKNENRTMPISTMIDGYLGIHDVCLSVPVVIGKNGISKMLKLALNKKEEKLFCRSAAHIRKEIDCLIK